jgi:hypothetical protein
VNVILLLVIVVPPNVAAAVYVAPLGPVIVTEKSGSGSGVLAYTFEFIRTTNVTVWPTIDGENVLVPQARVAQAG